MPAAASKAARGGRLSTKENGRAVFAAVARELGDAPLPEPLTIHVSGCIKGCAHRQQSDILALERNASYDVFEDSAPGTEPAPENHRGSASAETLPDLVAELARARIDRTRGGVRAAVASAFYLPPTPAGLPRRLSGLVAMTLIFLRT